PDVEMRWGREVQRREQLGLHGLPPPEPRRPRRRFGAAVLVAAWPKGLSDPLASRSNCSTSEVRSWSASTLSFVRFSPVICGVVAATGTKTLLPSPYSTSYESGKLPPR